MNKKDMFEINKGITLIALVITIIILIILAGVSISLVFDQEGIVNKAKKAADDMQIAANEESEKLADLLDKIETNTQIIKNNKANAPVLLTGMTPIKFTMPTEEKMGEVKTTTKSDSDWYEYGTTPETRKWANAKTQDGSMWVWIPRYAYKITYTDPSDKSKGGVIEVVFLKGTTDNYYDEEGNLKTAQRQKTADEVIDTTKDFTVHPAFTNESSINYANGGWDKELTGIWVAKFEAGYPQGNNNANVVASNVTYAKSNARGTNIEAGTSNQSGEGQVTARNWLDGIYGSETTQIKYPVFIPVTYSMNYIIHDDSYNIAKALTDSNNIYGFSSKNADSHLMKNSEWGAVAYLTQSIYGQNGKEITINNASLNSGNRQRVETAGKSGVDSVYAVTGCTSNGTNTTENITTIEEIRNVNGNNPTPKTDTLGGGIYVWNQLTGQNASTTGTIYGIYDLSGGTWEITSSYVANGNSYLQTYGKSMTYKDDTLKTASTKYTTIYPHNSTYDNTTISKAYENLIVANRNNFKENVKIYGDAVRETTSENAGTSNNGWYISAWNMDYSGFPGLYAPFFLRGGGLWNNHIAGLFSYEHVYGNGGYHMGFRAVVVPIN